MHDAPEAAAAAWLTQLRAGMSLVWPKIQQTLLEAGAQGEAWGAVDDHTVALLREGTRVGTCWILPFTVQGDRHVLQVSELPVEEGRAFGASVACCELP